MAISLQEQLDNVQAAIAKIERGGQDTSYDGKRVVKADINVLYRREQQLKRDIKREAAGGIVVSKGAME